MITYERFGDRVKNCQCFTINEWLCDHWPHCGIVKYNKENVNTVRKITTQ